MKRSNLFVFVLAIISLMAAACGGTAAPAAPINNQIGDLVIGDDPISPPDFKNDPNLAATLDQDLGYILLPAGLDPAGCLDTNPLVKKGLQLAISGYAAQGGQIPQRYQQLCLDPGVASFVHNTEIQTLGFALRDETLHVFIDGDKLGTLERAGVERALQLGSNVNFVPADAVDAVAFVFEAAEAMQVVDFDLFLYSWRYTYAHEADEQAVDYSAEIVRTDVAGTIDATATVTPTVVITGTLTTITMAYPRGFVEETREKVTVTSSERVAVEWPPLTRQAKIDAAAQQPALSPIAAEMAASQEGPQRYFVTPPPWEMAGVTLTGETFSPTAEIRSAAEAANHMAEKGYYSECLRIYFSAVIEWDWEGGDGSPNLWTQWVSWEETPLPTNCLADN